MSYAIITGASSGIGKSLARKFAKRKVNLVITSRRLNILNDMKQEIEKDFAVNVVCIQADLSKHEEVLKLVKAADKFDVQYVVNNAGVGSFEAMWDASKEWDQTMLNLNINALTFLMQHYLEKFVKQDKGSVINISSAGGALLFPGAAVYAATKWYVSTLSMETYLELKEAKSNAMIKCVEPGAISTDFFASSAVKVGKEKLMEGFKKHYNPEQVVSSEQVAEFTLDLLDSDKSMGRIVGDNKKMWNPVASPELTRNHIIKAVLETYKK